MKASELVKQINDQIYKHGDLDVKIYDNGCGGHYNCYPLQAPAGVDVRDRAIQIDTEAD